MNNIEIKTKSYFLYGTKQDQPIYGLYCPGLGCFLLVHYKIAYLELCKSLLISRYPTFIYNISQAENFFHEIIDNSVTINWSITNYHECKLKHAIANKSYDPIDAERLISSKLLYDKEFIVKEIEYCQLILYYVYYFDNNEYHWMYTILDSHLKSLGFDISEIHNDRISEIKNKVFKELFLGKNLSETANNINNILEETGQNVFKY